MITYRKPWTLMAAVLTGLLTLNGAQADPSAPSSPASSPAATPLRDGRHDFDFWVGEWRVHHRKLKVRLADSHDWMEFDGTSSVHLVMDGWGAIDDNTLAQPNGAYRSLGIRAYDPKTGQWSLWWLDGRTPANALDPALQGHFENGVGVFTAEDTYDGKPIRVRFTWSHITPNSADGEQAFSADGGKTWETNWFMHWQRVK